MKAAFLVRCSTDNQDYNRQLEDLKRVAKEFNFTIDEKHIFGEYITGKDDATKRDRISIERLKNAADRKEFDVILVNEVHRLSRDPVSGRVYIREFNNKGIPIYFRDEKRWTIDLKTRKVDTDFEKILGNRFDGAADYLNSLKVQTESGRRKKLNDNQFINGKVLFGYKKIGGKDKYKKNTLVVNENEKNIISDIYKKYLEEGSTLKSVSLSISAQYNSKFSAGRIYQILSNTTYHTGKITVTIKGLEETENETYILTVDPIISEQTYQKVKEKLRKNRSSVKPYNSKQKVHTLSRLIKCPICGHSFTPRKRTDKRKSYNWLCMSRINNISDCTSHINLNGDKVESIIWGLIKKESIFYDDINEEERDGRIKIEKESIKELEYEKEKLNYQLKLIEVENEKAYQLYLDAPDTIKEKVKSDYYNTLTINQQETNSINNIIETINTNINDSKNKIKRYSETDYSESYIKEVENDPKKKREVTVSIIEKIIPYKIAYRVVILKVDTIRDRFYILLNANQRKNREAYYRKSVIGKWDSSANSDLDMSNLVKLKNIIRNGGINKEDNSVNPFSDFILKSNDNIDFLSIKKEIEICKSKGWIIKY